MPAKNAISYIDKIKEIIDEWDPMDLLRYDDNEYFEIIEYVAAAIRTNSLPNVIERVLRSAFRQAYGRVCRIPDADYEQAAEKIFSLLQGEH